MRIIAIVMVSLVFLAVPSGAQVLEKRSLTPYCGIYSIYGAAKLTGRSVDAEQLLGGDYVSGIHGSTLADLDSAARALGFVSTPVERLSLSDLESLASLAIIHLDNTEGDQIFDHWVLLCSVDREGFNVIDGEKGLRRLDFDELNSFDGVALVLDAGLMTIWAARIKDTAHWILIAFSSLLVATGTIWWFTQKHSASGLSGTSTGAAFCGIAAAAISSTTAFNAFNREWSSELVPARTPEIQQLDSSITLVDLEAMQSQIASGRLLIDARYEEDYQAGHIPGAISIPYDSVASDFVRRSVDLDLSKGVLIYCESEDCTFGETLAGKFISIGVDAAIYSAGWRGWQEKLEGMPSD